MPSNRYEFRYDEGDSIPLFKVLCRSRGRLNIYYSGSSPLIQPGAPLGHVTATTPLWSRLVTVAILGELALLIYAQVGEGSELKKYSLTALAALLLITSFALSFRSSRILDQKLMRLAEAHVRATVDDRESAAQHMMAAAAGAGAAMGTAVAEVAQSNAAATTPLLGAPLTFTLATRR